MAHTSSASTAGGGVTFPATVTNGTEKVSAIFDRPNGSVAFTFTPEQAVEFAISLLNGAANVREGTHGNDGAEYTNRVRAHKSLNWEPPVSIPGELITQLARSKSRTEGDRRAAIAAVVKAAGR